jgi:thioredoxin-like negative regulator of GroEL
MRQHPGVTMSVMDAEQAFGQAQTLLQSGQSEAARRRLVDLVSAHPNHVEGWLLLATVVDVNQAVDCLRRVLAMDPAHPRALKWLPLAEREQARLAEAAPQAAPGPAEAEDDVPLAEPGDDERPVPRLGQYLLDFKFVSAEQLKAALAAQRRARAKGEARRVGDLLLEQGAITEERLNFALRAQRRGSFSQFQG